MVPKNLNYGMIVVLKKIVVLDGMVHNVSVKQFMIILILLKLLYLFQMIL